MFWETEMVAMEGLMEGQRTALLDGKLAHCVVSGGNTEYLGGIEDFSKEKMRETSGDDWIWVW